MRGSIVFWITIFLAIMLSIIVIRKFNIYPKTQLAAIHLNKQNDLVGTKHDDAADSEVSHENLISAINDNNREAVQKILSHGININEKHDSEGGWMPLHYAASNGFLEIAELLLNNGADVNQKGQVPEDSNFRDTGETPLMVAAGRGNLKMVEYLIKQGARINEWDNTGSTALLYAIEYNHIPVVEYLISQGAELNTNPSPLVSARASDDLVKLLLSRGADVNQQDDGGKTVLIYATDDNNVERVSYLLKNGATAQLEDDGGRTALHYAARNGNIEIAQLLIKHGADIDHNAFGGGGELSFCGTPLMTAVQSNRLDMVKFFLNKGAKTQIKDALTGQTALDIANQVGNNELIELLKSCKGL